MPEEEIVLDENTPPEEYTNIVPEISDEVEIAFNQDPVADLDEEN